MAGSKRVATALEKELLRLQREVRAHVEAHKDLAHRFQSSGLVM
jgi:hypothetical protein